MESASDPTSPIPVTAEVLEPMGDEIFVYLALSGDGELTMGEAGGSDRLLMSVGAESDVAEDDELEVVLDWGNLHLFETRSGEAITNDLSTDADARGTDPHLEAGKK